MGISIQVCETLIDFNQRRVSIDKTIEFVFKLRSRFQFGELSDIVVRFSESMTGTQFRKPWTNNRCFKFQSAVWLTCCPCLSDSISETDGTRGRTCRTSPSGPKITVDGIFAELNCDTT